MTEQEIIDGFLAKMQSEGAAIPEQFGETLLQAFKAHQQSAVDERTRAEVRQLLERMIVDSRTKAPGDHIGRTTDAIVAMIGNAVLAEREAGLAYRLLSGNKIT